MTMLQALSDFNYKVINQATTFLVYKFDLKDEINASTVAKKLKLCLEGRTRKTIDNTDRPGFLVTDTEVFTPKTNQMFDDLIHVIEQKVTKITHATQSHVKQGIVNISPKVETFWGAFYQKGDSATWHRHQDIYCFQAVYYAEVSDDTPLVFRNNGIGGTDYSVKPYPGLLLVFDGSTEHMVPEVTSEGTRLVFASNLVYVRT